MKTECSVIKDFDNISNMQEIFGIFGLVFMFGLIMVAAWAILRKTPHSNPE